MSNQQSTNHSAGAFDIRNVIGTLLGIYGIVLIICSFLFDPGVNPDTGLAKEATDNLYAGIGMLAVAIGFALWAKFAPIVVAEDQ